MPARGGSSYVFGPFRLDPAEQQLVRDGKPVPLTPKALQTLIVLVERRGHLVTKDELFQLVWPDTFVEDNNLAQNISMLRRALGDGDNERGLVETVPRRGYRFIGAVVERVDDDVDDGAAGERQPVPVDDTLPGLAADAGGRLRRVGSWMSITGIAVVLAIGFAIRSRDGAPDVTAGPVAATGIPAVPSAGTTRLAVLPFRNLGAAADEYFVAGMTDEIIGRLAGLRRIAVPSSTTVAAYARQGKGLRRIGADLGVDYVLEGSVHWGPKSEGRQVRITPRLIRVADDTTVWAGEYDTALPDLFRVQADIAYRIAGALRVVLDARERQAIEARPTTDAEAYLSYLRGLAAFQQGASDTGQQSRARTELEDAVARDPRFALAWSWLAQVYASQYQTGAQRNPETRQAARHAADTALALDSNLGEVRLGLAYVLLVDRDFEGSLREIRIANAGLPSSPGLFRMLGDVLQRRGQWSQARDAYQRAFGLDPLSTSDRIAIYYLHLRQYAEARRFIEIAKAGNRVVATVPEAWTYFSETGDVAAARQVLERALAGRTPADARVRGLLAHLEWFDGRHRRALQLIEEMDAAGTWLPANLRMPAALAAAQVYESLGRRNEAASFYARALAELEGHPPDALDDYQIHIGLGLAAAGLGRADEAVRHGLRAETLVQEDAVHSPVVVYLLAQIHARLGQREAAFATLDRLFENPGFYNEVWVTRDPGFSRLWRDPAFPHLVERWSTRKGDVLIRAPSDDQSSSPTER